MKNQIAWSEQTDNVKAKHHTLLSMTSLEFDYRKYGLHSISDCCVIYCMLQLNKLFLV